ncbi:hypothetical protein HYR69_10625, partial [Candidatus Sumerlaeota bacterium]|nr:hypothetical protein [Candidatus Sumerlaeota bacterium]
RWILDGKISDFFSKLWKGLDANLMMALTAASPLALGIAAHHVWRDWERLTPRIRSLAVFTFSAAAVWIALFSIGEFEGARFFVPLTPLVLLLCVSGLCSAGEAADSAGGRGLRRGFLLAIIAVLLLPGIFRLTQLLGPERKDPFRSALGEVLDHLTPPDAVILSDAPWVTAWYGDRTSVWIPSRIEETPAVARRASASYVMLTPAVSDPENGEPWKRIFYTAAGYPADWKPIPAGPMEGTIRLFVLPKREQ